MARRTRARSRGTVPAATPPGSRGRHRRSGGRAADAASGAAPTRGGPARDCAGPRRTRTPARVDGEATRGAREYSPPWGPRYHRRVPDPGQTRAYVALTLISGLWGSYPPFAKLPLA